MWFESISVASIFSRSRIGVRQMRTTCSRRISVYPFAQRCCWLLYAVIWAGSSAGSLQVAQVDELPPLEVGADRDLGVLGERGRGPAARVVDRAAAPDAARAVEVEESAGAVAVGRLEDEVAVDEEALDVRQEVLVEVQVVPARLHEPDLRGREVGHRLAEEIRRGDEVGVEDRDELRVVPLEPGGERPRLEPLAVAPAEVLDRHPPRLQLGARARRGLDRLVRRVVEELDPDPVAGVVEPLHRIEDAAHDLALVVDGDLHEDGRQDRGVRRPHRVLLPHPQVDDHHPHAVEAVAAEQARERDVEREEEDLEERHPYPGDFLG